MAGNNLAFDFDLFDNTVNRKSSAAPEIKQPTRPKEVPQKSRTRKELKAEARYTRRQAIKIIAVSLLLLLFLGSSVYLRAVISDLEYQKDSISVTMKEAKSENVRLRSEVEAIFSIDNISAYAEEKLGMIKKDGYQVTYFEVESETENNE